MPEPGTLLLGSLALFAPIFKAAKALHEGWKLTVTFPSDMHRESLLLEMYYCIFANKAELNVYDLCHRVDPDSEHHPETRMLLQSLVATVDLFRECDCILEKYKPKSTLTSKHLKNFLLKLSGPRRRLCKPAPQDPGLLQSPETASAQSLKPKGHTNINVDTPSGAGSAPEEAESRRKSRFLPWERLKKLARSKSKPAQGSSTEAESLSRSPSREDRERATTRTTRLLNAPDLQEHHAQREEDVQSLSEIGLGRRIIWVAKDKKALKGKVENIKRVIELMDEYFKLREPRGSSLLPKTNATRMLHTKAREQMQVLDALHRSLKKLNTEGEPSGPYLLSIKIQEHVQESRDELEELPGIQLQKSSRVFFLQRHEKLAADDNPTTLAVESSITSDQELHTLEHLTGPSTLCRSGEVGAKGAGIEKWGNCPPVDNGQVPFRTNTVYHVTAATYKPGAVLSDVIASKEYRRFVTPFQLYQLARIIAVTYLHFTLVRPKCGNPRLHNFQYYCESEENTHWDTDDPLVLKPWLFFGFGSRTSQRQPGAGSGISKSTNVSLVELGLLLFQIAVGTQLPYNTGSKGLKSARAQALSNIKKVTNVLGVPFTRIVCTCLNYQGPDLYLPEPERITEGEIQKLEEVISALYVEGHAFEDNESSAFSFAVFSHHTITPGEAVERGSDSAEVSNLTETTAITPRGVYGESREDVQSQEKDYDFPGKDGAAAKESLGQDQDERKHERQRLTSESEGRQGLTCS